MNRIRWDYRGMSLWIRIKKYLRRPLRCKLFRHKVSGGERGWDLRSGRVEYHCDNCMALVYWCKLDDSPDANGFIAIHQRLKKGFTP